MFRISTPTGWLVVVDGPQLINDLRKATEDELSFHEASKEVNYLVHRSWCAPLIRSLEQLLQIQHTFGSVHRDQFQVNVVRDKFTRSLSALYPDIRDEAVTALEELLPAAEGESSCACSDDLVDPSLIQRVPGRLDICRGRAYVQRSHCARE